ncbi:hypothetical protein [Benzoatithermus flavus]|uniref:Uncharacterized protein n=1 Tax=Benzoatithermus flavus TaxID=3108223 RepID=A0ABU8XL89_9PROT
MLDELLENGEAHEGEPDPVLVVSAGKGSGDRCLGTRHAVAEQHQQVRCDPRDRGIDVGGRPETRRHVMARLVVLVGRWEGAALGCKVVARRRSGETT